MPPQVNWLVPQVQLTGNNVVLTINVGGFSFGNWAEISGYIIQDDVIVGNAIQQPGAIIPFSAIQAVPDPATGPSSVTVSIAAQGLNPNTDVRVITRVAEVQIWPTGLQRDSQAAASVTRWQARQGNPDSGSQAQRYNPQSSAAGSAITPAATVRVSDPGPRVSVKNLRPGRQYRITVDEGPE
jgi:hypothetical protein